MGKFLRFESTHVLLLVSSVVVLVLDWLEKVHVENLREQTERGKKENKRKVSQRRTNASHQEMP